MILEGRQLRALIDPRLRRIVDSAGAAVLGLGEIVLILNPASLALREIMAAVPAAAPVEAAVPVARPIGILANRNCAGYPWRLQ